MHVAYSADDTEAKIFKQELEEEFTGHTIDIMDPLSLSVSCHIGPGALAVAISKVVDELQWEREVAEKGSAEKREPL